MKFLIFVLIFSFSNCCFAAEKDAILVQYRPGTGMFSQLHDVLAGIKMYDLGHYRGLEINFAQEGVYYTPERGDNWWSYYFEPIRLGSLTRAKSIIGDPPFSRPWEIEKHTTRAVAFTLIQKYIHIKPEILAKIARFQARHFAGHHVLCVHYRGTDKLIADASLVTYEEMLDAVQKTLLKQPTKKWKIFVATDEQSFLEKMIDEYGDYVCYYDSHRSAGKDPIHLAASDPYLAGEEALIDAVLLSRGNHLIRTSSNLSRWSTFFNPIIPVVQVGF